MTEQIRMVAEQALSAMIEERTATAVTTEADVAEMETTPLRMIGEETKTAVLAGRVREADNEEAVKAVLMSFLKVRDMAEVYKAVTGYTYAGRIVGVKKEEIATYMAGQIMRMRETGAFKTLSVEEKYEELKKLSDLPRELSLCTMPELEEIAGQLGIMEDANVSHSEYEKRRMVEAQITESLKAVKLEALKRANREEAHEMLKECDTKILGEIARAVSSDFSDRMAEARAKYSGEELIEWAITWVIEKLGETEMENEAVAEIEAKKEEMPIEEETLVESEAEAPAETEAETQSGTTSVKPEIAFPLEEHTAESLKNLIYTIYSRGNLMSKATGGEFWVSDSIIEELKEYGNTKDEVLEIIRSAGEEWLHGLTFEEDKVVFTGFPATEDEIKSRANILLAEAINKNCLEQKRVQAKKVDESNEKFSFRVWLARLGLNGSETKAERKTFYGNLTGHTAFRTKEDEEKWYARRRASASASKA